MRLAAESVRFDHVNPQSTPLPEEETDEASHRD